MTWEAVRSLERIRRFKASVPETGIELEDFAQEYLPRRAALAKAQLMSEAASAAIVDIPRNRAIMTDAVHIYADLMDFGDQLTAERETQAGFGRALQFLHLHYGGCDRLIDAFGLQRVDFHGSRLHAVVLTPAGSDNELERIARALAFARAFEELVARTGERFGGRYRTRVAIGIDSGKAIAINSGRGGEQEPLFIGRPANHAAKLAARGNPGLNLSERVKAVIALAPEAMSPNDLVGSLTRRGGAALAPDHRRTLQETASMEIASYETELRGVEASGALPTFVFHQHTPPLRTINFADLPPSRAILMPMACVFADLDEFTAYVDEALSNGHARQAVANLHVIRGELAAALREDFGGRKVRFIGDCLQGVIAEGDSATVDPVATVEAAVLAAGGLRSSFELCRRELPGVERLGLAIGLDYGMTPACRIGLRGESSVRCVTSPATCESETVQQSCGRIETGLGAAALDAGGVRVRRVFGANAKVPNLDYGAARALLGGLPAVQVGQVAVPAVQAHAR